MRTTISAAFETRRDADMAVEHLVQEHGVERSDIFVAAEGDSNSAGMGRDGSDNESGGPSPEAREDGAHAGAISVSVDVNDEGFADRITGTFEDFGGTVQKTE